jgi:hypothetical protein
MPSKKKTNKNNSAVVEDLKSQVNTLQTKIFNQRKALHDQPVLNRTQDMNVANRQNTGNHTLGQNPVGRTVTTAGGVLSNRDVSLLWRELGSTDDGRNFSMCALHPCSENLSAVQGIPDHSAQPIATPGYRNTSTIAMPTALSTTNWDCQIVYLPIPEVDYVWRARENASADWSAWNLVRPASFPALATGTGKTLGTSGYSKYRMMGRGYTVHHLASATTDQGVVVAGQISALKEDYVALPVPAETNATLYQTGFLLPSGAQQLTQQDNLATEWDARHGTYMPLRFDQTVELYKQAGTGGIGTFTTPSGSTAPVHYAVIESAVSEGGTVGVNNIVATPVPTFTPPTGTVDATQMIYAASQSCNQLVGVQFFLGIDKAATLQVKSRMFIEATALADGYDIQPFVHSSPVLDSKALSVVATVAQVQKHCYYAEFNDLGKMLQSIWNAVWPIGKSIATGGLSFVPGIGGGLSAAAGRVKNPFAGKDWWSNL